MKNVEYPSTRRSASIVHAWQGQGEFSQEGDSRQRIYTTITVSNLRPSSYTLRNSHK
jgi:hypothetical protein